MPVAHGKPAGPSALLPGLWWDPRFGLFLNFLWKSWAVSGMMGRIHMVLLVFSYIIVCPGAVWDPGFTNMITGVTMKSSWCFAPGLIWALTLPNMENWNVELVTVMNCAHTSFLHLERGIGGKRWGGVDLAVIYKCNRFICKNSYIYI